MTVSPFQMSNLKWSKSQQMKKEIKSELKMHEWREKEKLLSASYRHILMQQAQGFIYQLV